MTTPQYLTESLLGEYLKNKFGDDVKTQYRLQNNTRVDFMISGVQMDYDCITDVAVEFDGYQHYQQGKVIHRDINNQILLKQANIHVIHIPYFVQASFAIPFYFNTNRPDVFYGNDPRADFPHGFVDSKCVHPIDFSYTGWYRFVYEVYHYPTPIREQIRVTMTSEENNIFDRVFSDIQTSNVTPATPYVESDWISKCMFG